ncbi:hypothetical protein DPSP01_006432 [Paraphaeosphaeria sporulosa]
MVAYGVGWIGSLALNSALEVSLIATWGEDQRTMSRSPQQWVNLLDSSSDRFLVIRGLEGQAHRTEKGRRGMAASSRAGRTKNLVSCSAYRSAQEELNVVRYHGSRRHVVPAVRRIGVFWR